MPLSSSRFIVSIPAALIFCQKVPAAILLTWLQLRYLAGESQQTPPLTYRKITRLFGKSRTGLYNHLDLLRRYGLLQITAQDGGYFIASFADFENQLASIAEPQPDCGPSPAFDANSPPSGEPQQPGGASGEDQNPESGNWDSALILNHLLNIDLRIKELREEAESRIRDSEQRFSKEQVPLEAESDSARIYRQVTHLSLRPGQRALLNRETIDLAVWQPTLEHWTLHAWNPLNLAGMLDLYRRGGPTACRVCHPETPVETPPLTQDAAGHDLPRPGKKSGRKPPLSLRQQRSLQSLTDLRKEGEHGDQG